MKFQTLLFKDLSLNIIWHIGSKESIMVLVRGASSYLDGKRYTNICDIDEYIKKISNDEDVKMLEETETLESKIKEYIMLGLRKIDGININEVNKKFEIDVLNKFSNELEKLVKFGLIEVNDSIKLTDKGLDLANVVWQEFV